MERNDFYCYIKMTCVEGALNKATFSFGEGMDEWIDKVVTHTP